MLCWYTGGNEKITENLRGFFKNEGISLEIFSWSGKKDRKVKILPDEEIEDIK